MPEHKSKQPIVVDEDEPTPVATKPIVVDEDEPTIQTASTYPAPQAQPQVPTISNSDFYKKYILSSNIDESPEGIAQSVKDYTANNSKVLAQDIAENAPQGYTGNLPFDHPQSPVNQLTDIHGDPNATAAWWQHRLSTLEQQKQADIAKNATTPRTLENLTPENTFYNTDNNVIVDDAKKKQIEEQYDAKRRQLYNAVDNTLQLQIFNQAVNKLGVSPELDKGKTAVDLGVQYFALLGDPKALQAQKRIQSGKPLTEDENVAYGSKGTDIMKAGAANADANGNNILAQDAFKTAEKARKDIVTDNPNYFKQVRINAISTQKDLEENPISKVIFGGNPVISKSDIKRWAEQAAVNDYSDITPQDINLRSPLIAKAAQGLTNSLVGTAADLGAQTYNLYNQSKRAAGLPYDAYTQSLVQDYLQNGGFEGSKAGKIFTGTEPESAQQIYNPTTGIQWQNVAGEMASGAGSLAGILAGGAALKGAGLGEHMANAALMGLQGANSAYSNSFKVIGDEPEKEPQRLAYSLLNGTLNAALFSIDPQLSIAQDALGMTKAGSEVAQQLASKGIESFTKTALKDKIVNATIETAKHVGLQMGLAAADKVGEHVVDKLFNPNASSLNDADLVNAAAGAGIGMFLPSLMAGINNPKSKTPLSQGIAWEVGNNPDKFRDQIHEMVSSGTINNSDAARAITAINTLSQTANRVNQASHIDGTPLNDKEKADYLWYSAQQQSLLSKENRLPEKSVERKAIESKRADIETQMGDILNQEGDYAPSKQAKQEMVFKPLYTPEERAAQEAEQEPPTEEGQPQGQTVETQPETPEETEGEKETQNVPENNNQQKPLSLLSEIEKDNGRSYLQSLRGQDNEKELRNNFYDVRDFANKIDRTKEANSNTIYELKRKAKELKDNGLISHDEEIALRRKINEIKEFVKPIKPIQNESNASNQDHDRFQSGNGQETQSNGQEGRSTEVLEGSEGRTQQQEGRELKTPTEPQAEPGQEEKPASVTALPETKEYPSGSQADLGKYNGQPETGEAKADIKNTGLDQRWGETGETPRNFIDRIKKWWFDHKATAKANDSVIAHSSVMKVIEEGEKTGWDEENYPKILETYYDDKNDLNPGEIHTYQNDKGENIHLVRHPETYDTEKGNFRAEDDNLTPEGRKTAEEDITDRLENLGVKPEQVSAPDESVRTTEAADIVKEGLKEKSQQQKNNPFKNNKAVGDAFKKIFDALGRDDLEGLLDNWNGSRLSYDGNDIISTIDKRMGNDLGPKRKGGKKAFLNWLISDEPLDEKIYSQDEDWVDLINKARESIGIKAADIVKEGLAKKEERTDNVMGLQKPSFADDPLTKEQKDKITDREGNRSWAAVNRTLKKYLDEGNMSLDKIFHSLGYKWINGIWVEPLLIEKYNTVDFDKFTKKFKKLGGTNISASGLGAGGLSHIRESDIEGVPTKINSIKLSIFPDKFEFTDPEAVLDHELGHVAYKYFLDENEKNIIKNQNPSSAHGIKVKKQIEQKQGSYRGFKNHYEEDFADTYSENESDLIKTLQEFGEQAIKEKRLTQKEVDEIINSVKQKLQEHATKESSQQVEEGNQQGSKPEHTRVEPQRNEETQPTTDNSNRGIGSEEKPEKQQTIAANALRSYVKLNKDLRERNGQVFINGIDSDHINHAILKLADLIDDGWNLHLAIRESIKSAIKEFGAAFNHNDLRRELMFQGIRAYGAENAKRIFEHHDLPRREDYDLAKQQIERIKFDNNGDPQKAFDDAMDTLSNVKFKGMTEEASNKRKSDIADFIYAHTLGDYRPENSTPIGDKKTSWIDNVEIERSGETAQYLTQQTQQDIYGEEAALQDPEKYEITQIRNFVKGGMDIIGQAMKRYDPSNTNKPITEYGGQLLNDIKLIDANKHDGGAKKVMALSALNNELIRTRLDAEAELKNPKSTPQEQLQKIINDSKAIQKKVEAYQNEILHDASLALNARRTSRIFRNEFLHDYYENRILSEAQRQRKADIEEALDNSEIEDEDLHEGLIAPTESTEEKERSLERLQKENNTLSAEHQRLKADIEKGQQQKSAMMDDFNKKQADYEQKIADLQEKLKDKDSKTYLRDDLELSKAKREMKAMTEQHEAKVKELEAKIKALEGKERTEAKKKAKKEPENRTASSKADAAEKRSEIRDKIGDPQSFLDKLKSLKNPC